MPTLRKTYGIFCSEDTRNLLFCTLPVCQHYGRHMEPSVRKTHGIFCSVHSQYANTTEDIWNLLFGRHTESSVLCTPSIPTLWHASYEDMQNLLFCHSQYASNNPSSMTF